MKRFGVALMILCLFTPRLAPAAVEGPPPGPPAAFGPEAPPWFSAQAGPPPPPPGPGSQPPRPPRGMGAWWKNSDIAKKLELSEAQVGRIEQTFLEHRLRLIDLRADLDKQELRLRPLLDADRPDEAQVAAQIDLITAARGRLEKETALMMLAIRRVLSVEQWKKLQALQREREGGPGRPDGPGGPPGPGPQPPRRPANPPR